MKCSLLDAGNAWEHDLHLETILLHNIFDLYGALRLTKSHLSAILASCSGNTGFLVCWLQGHPGELPGCVRNPSMTVVGVACLLPSV